MKKIFLALAVAAVGLFAPQAQGATIEERIMNLYRDAAIDAHTGK